MRARTGGLIVSAGVGFALLSGWGCGIASADPTDSTDSSSSSSDGSDAGSGSDDTSSSNSTKTESQKTSDVDKTSDGDKDDDADKDEDADKTSEDEDAGKDEDEDEDDDALTVTQVVAERVAVAQPSSTADDEPSTPRDNPAQWAVAAAARREAGVTVDEQADIEPAPAAVVAEEPLPPDWEDQYVGAPSFVHQLVVVGLRVVDTVLKPFGGLLKFTSLKVPLFTDGVPPFFLRHGLDVQRTEFDGMPVWTLQPKNATEKVVVALHGGAYVAEASLFHWWTYTDMARDTGATVVVPLYQLVPDGGTAEVEVPKTADFIEQLIIQHGAANVSVIGDSAGGGLALAAVQEMVHRGSAVPSRMVLFAPWLDAGVSDPLSRALDPGDPLLDVPNLQQAGQDWAGGVGTDHRFASPLYGSLEGLPPTTVYSGSLDLLTPDSLRLQRLVEQGQYPNFTFNLRRDLIHDWAIFGFIPEAIAVRPSVYQALLGG